MGGGTRELKDDLQGLISQLRHLLTFDAQLGMDVPRLSPSDLLYLDSGPVRSFSLEDVREEIGECQRCKLSQGRTAIVFGEGAEKARLVFVGEAPGQEEDLSGRPFVGEAGKLLNGIIEKGMRLKRQDVYICNVVKCRPPQNREPERDEIKACIPFLKKQLESIQPQVICALGRIAAQSLLGRAFKMTQERGRWFSFMDIPLMPTYHPAYILRNPSRERELKRLVWQDVQEIMKRLGLEVKGNV